MVIRFNLTRNAIKQSKSKYYINIPIEIYYFENILIDLTLYKFLFDLPLSDVFL